MALKHIIDDGKGNITYRDETDSEKSAREAKVAAQEAKRYQKNRTVGSFDESTGKNTKTTYGNLSEQLDMLYRDVAAGKFGDDAKTGEWYVHVKKTKDDNPKPE